MTKRLGAMARSLTAPAAPGPPGPPDDIDLTVRPVCAICEVPMVELACVEVTALRAQRHHIAGGCGKGARPGELHSHWICQSPHPSVPITVTYRVRRVEPGSDGTA